MNTTISAAEVEMKNHLEKTAFKDVLFKSTGTNI